MDNSCEKSPFLVQVCGTSWSGAIAACEEFDMTTRWGRMVSCGRLEIGLLLISRKLWQADFQPAPRKPVPPSATCQHMVAPALAGINRSLKQCVIAEL